MAPKKSKPKVDLGTKDKVVPAKLGNTISSLTLNISIYLAKFFIVSLKNR
jgi:hypothetical protein